MARRPLAGALIVLICSILLPFLCLAARTAQDVADIGAKRHEQFELKPDHAGYLPIDEKLGSAIYYAYFEARNPRGKLEETPVILWLQVHWRPAGTHVTWQLVGPAMAWQSAHCHLVALISVCCFTLVNVMRSFAMCRITVCQCPVMPCANQTGPCHSSYARRAAPAAPACSACCTSTAPSSSTPPT